MWKLAIFQWGAEGGREDTEQHFHKTFSRRNSAQQWTGHLSHHELLAGGEGSVREKVDKLDHLLIHFEECIQLCEKNKHCAWFLFYSIIKDPLSASMTTAKRRTRKKHSKANIPHSNKEAAGECFRHVCSINTHVLLTTEPKTQSPLQVCKGLHINEPPQRWQENTMWVEHKTQVRTEVTRYCV